MELLTTITATIILHSSTTLYAYALVFFLFSFLFKEMTLSYFEFALLTAIAATLLLIVFFFFNTFGVF